MNTKVKSSKQNKASLSGGYDYSNDQDDTEVSYQQQSERKIQMYQDLASNRNLLLPNNHSYSQNLSENDDEDDNFLMFGGGGGGVENGGRVITFATPSHTSNDNNNRSLSVTSSNGHANDNSSNNNPANEATPTVIHRHVSNVSGVSGKSGESRNGSQADLNSTILDNIDDSDDEESDTDMFENESTSEQSHDAVLSKRESQKLQGFQCVVTVVLLIISTLVVVATYMFLAREDLIAFESSFYQYANSIRDSANFRSKRIVNALQSRAEGITSYTMDEDKIWPFVTIPHFAIKGANIINETSVDIIGYAPFVKSLEQKQQWELYVMEQKNAALVALDASTSTATAAAERGQQNNNNNISVSPVINQFANNFTSIIPDTNSDSIKSINGGSKEPIYLPIFQTEPIIESIINLNFMDGDDENAFFEPLIETMVETNRSVMSEEMRYRLSAMINGGNKEAQDGSSYSKASNGHPYSIIFHPVFNNFYPINRKIVACLFAILPWDIFFSNLLPDNIIGIYCILHNSCGESHTYLINGKNATYLGEGDLHEDEYSYLEVAIRSEFIGRKRLQDDIQSIPTTIIEENTALDDEYDDYCMYDIRVYPSLDLEWALYSGRPKVYTSIVLVAFGVTACVFYSYVRYLQQRNNVILATALHTSKIVSSLFPSNVRARIMEDAQQKVKNDNKNRSAIGSTGLVSIPNIPGMMEGASALHMRANINSRNLRTFLNTAAGPQASMFNINLASGVSVGSGLGVNNNKDNNKNKNKPRDSGMSEIFDTKPIADLFPNCTVLFADLVGFTAWSSVREPTQVFQLLEAIFHSFDEVANRRRVFKVETVGDCYVAVTGLPDPRKDHAVVMARFATETLTKMLQLVKKLELTLGPGTADLTMRFGMHSGAVTAGVLRGEKSRFQLFGDTVNTAARMESNGKKDCIHCSQDTADLLIAAGKKAWVLAREDKILAKGKGEMQTYWIDLNGHRSKVKVRVGGAGGKRPSNLTKQQSMRLSMNEGATKSNEMREVMKRRSKSHSDLIDGLSRTSSVGTVSEGEEGGEEEDTERTGGESFDVSGGSSVSECSSIYEEELDDVQKRLVRWVVDLLSRLLKQIVAQRSLVDAALKGDGVDDLDRSGGSNRSGSSSKKSKKGRRFRSSKTVGSRNSSDDEVKELREQVQKAQELQLQKERMVQLEQQIGSTVSLEELKDAISLPPFDDNAVQYQFADLDSIELDHDVNAQLNEYVTTIATLYNDNEFHNFAHASHVTMAVTKLISRITSQEVGDIEEEDDNPNDESAMYRALEKVHERTFGISSDPVAQFAIVFAALIHDVDHSGVSNEQLVLENSKIAKLYNWKCVLEQNSIDLAWSILMDSRYDKLRLMIYTNEAELLRFRSVVINTVIATDILDEELRHKRNLRWENAFAGLEGNISKRPSTTTSMGTATTVDTSMTQHSAMTNDNTTNVTDIIDRDPTVNINRRATLVMEYLIQASNLAHTMQHWAVYRKWNEKLFREEYYSYLSGRCGGQQTEDQIEAGVNDVPHPGDYWYERELDFFDNCVIPVAMKLKTCGVFGIYSDEYLECALKNRAEWELRGYEILEEMIESVMDINHESSIRNNNRGISLNSVDMAFF